ncbi:conserved Plasmodium membrane protein, unknown function [Plasmodium ovale curtisi]|uniref:Uncharacterized protein n=1 Tax=Plasmodium ovale curtisi TaxID=864141 RepID=A0A1A8VRT1_PLAOA|nr:conserved Plasmodium membrane protein, unknown function [Plasmodium ovale curtisi]SBT00173.1 conserved Plasmodium membrane protein, unknown function [Plasmodium ovale curtisi]
MANLSGGSNHSSAHSRYRDNRGYQGSWLGMPKRLSPFESLLAHYVLKQLVSLFFVSSTTNYSIEVCLCKELTVSNLFYTKCISFCTLERDKGLLNFFTRVILGEKQKRENSHIEHDAGHSDVSSSKWNIFLLKILNFYYNKHRKTRKGRGNNEGKNWSRKRKKEIFFFHFSQYIISLFHHENETIKRKDKLLFLFLFFLFITRYDVPPKRRCRTGKGPLISRENEKASPCSHKGGSDRRGGGGVCDNCYGRGYLAELFEEGVRKRFRRINKDAVRKLLGNHLYHVHVLDENWGNGKKVLLLCKKALFCLNQICMNHLKYTKNEWSDKTHLASYSDEIFKSTRLLKLPKGHYQMFLRPFYHVTNMERNYTPYPFLVLLRGYMCRKKAFSFSQGMFRRSYFCRKKNWHPPFVKRYLLLFYHTFFHNHKKGMNIYDVQNMEHIDKEEGENELVAHGLCTLPRWKTQKSCEKKKKKINLFIATCVCISLMYNNSYYDLYYFFILMLRKRRSLNLFRKVNYFVDELVKMDAKCQYQWNVKNMLFYFYINMYHKRKEYHMKKCKEGVNRLNSSLRFAPSRRILPSNVEVLDACEKGTIFLVMKNRSKNVVIFNEKKVNQKGRIIKQKMCAGTNSVSNCQLRVKHIALNYDYAKGKLKKEKKKRIAWSSQLLKFIHKNFDFFLKILECKSYNYMAASHIFIFYNSFVHLFDHPLHISLRGNTTLHILLEEKYRALLHKNIYYYAFHNSLLLIYVQKVYRVLLILLRDHFYIFFKKNMYTYNLDLLFHGKKCNGKGRKIPKGEHIHENYKMFAPNYECHYNAMCTNFCKNNGKNGLHNYKCVNCRKKHINKRIMMKGYDTVCTFCCNMNRRNNLLYSDNNAPNVCISHNSIDYTSNSLYKLIRHEGKRNDENYTYIGVNRTEEKSHHDKITRNNCVHVKNTYVEFYLFEKKKKKNYEQDRYILPFLLYKKVKGKMTNYKSILLEMIKLLNRLYSEKYYVHFYANCVRNILYCVCNCSFFSLELFYNFIVPLFLRESKYLNGQVTERLGGQTGKEHSYRRRKQKGQRAMTTALRNFDGYFTKELKYLKEYYALFKCTHGEENVLTRSCNHLQRISLCVNKTHLKCKMERKSEGGKGKKWITTYFHIFSINPNNPDTHINLLIAYKKMQKKKINAAAKGKGKKKVLIRNYHCIFFKCIINVIHEHSLHIYHMLTNYAFMEKENLIHATNFYIDICASRNHNHFSDVQASKKEDGSKRYPRNALLSNTTKGAAKNIAKNNTFNSMNGKTQYGVEKNDELCKFELNLKESCKGNYKKDLYGKNICRGIKRGVYSLLNGQKKKCLLLGGKYQNKDDARATLLWSVAR